MKILICLLFFSCSKQVKIQRIYDNNYDTSKVVFPYSIDNNKLDSIYIYSPISFNLINSLNSNMKFESFTQNKNQTHNDFIVNNKFYRTSDIKIHEINFSPKSENKIIIYLKYKIAFSNLDLSNQNKIKAIFQSRQKDSIVIKNNSYVDKELVKLKNDDFLILNLKTNSSSQFYIYCFINNSFIKLNETQIINTPNLHSICNN